MDVHVTLHGFPEKRRDVTLAEGATAEDLVRALGILPELVLVFRDRVPIPSTQPLRAGDALHVLRVVSGG